MNPSIIFFLDTVHPKVWESLEAAGFDCRDHSATTVEALKDLISEATGLIIRHRLRLDAELLDHARSLKWIARSGVGLDNIDQEYCAERGIQVINGAGGNADAVGEQVIGMLLMLFNHLKRADSEVRDGKWNREANRGRELGKMTVGIIGYGHTGQSLAQKLSGFGCKVLAYDKYASVTGPYAEEATLSIIQAEADILSFHVPLTEETHHYFDRKFLAYMAAPFYLVNASRGGVCDASSIADGIQSGKILGACLDVLEKEGKDGSQISYSDEHMQYLINSEQVLFSPHIAGWTVESYENLADVLIQRVLDIS